MRVIFTGDTHGDVATRLENIKRNMDNIVPEETAVIIFGDAGLNYYLNKTDRKNKQRVSNIGIRVYCVRGNHEKRPQDVPGMVLVYDQDVNGFVYMEEKFPLIRYLVDGGEYTINGRTFLVIGGAYSVDKYYRLARSAGCGFSGWFENEQLSAEERDEILNKVKGNHYNFVLTHTAPIIWEPSDLFLSGIDQSTVEKDMEYWLKDVSDRISWDYWMFGHYHADRIEAPHVEQFYMEYEDLDDVVERWERYDETGELEWWLPKSPRMKAIMKDMVANETKSVLS